MVIIPLSAEVSHPCAEASPTTAPKKCADLCLDDTECPGNSKCRPTNCGFQCKLSQPGTSSLFVCISDFLLSPTTATTLAATPRSRLSSASTPTSGQPLKGLLLTSAPPGYDKENKWDNYFFKYVFFGSLSETERSGVCPVVFPETLGLCWDWCSSDRDCSIAKKCCQIGCTRVCTEPLLGKLSSLDLCEVSVPGQQDKRMAGGALLKQAP
ncbi:hypothetical protein JD844_019401 [Phrynosoma platyrhinos]|uniref:WAP domain-containing protein n=1 Tax=Phrynosoma platyrhinos TaxID=52577 RepID=A0ABQ7SPX1_PHRPL|nr:hypothetical protein JD844_019401 [Phrynosoma platyrhinos]